MDDVFARLAAPFPPERVSWRVGPTSGDKSKGIALAYIDARDVMDRLDTVLGPQSWQCRYPHANGKTVCEIGLLAAGPNGNEWIWKADGAGDTDMEAEKGALSDAFKRAAVRWGIGRYLYDIDSPWVEIEQRGKSYTIKQSEFAKLRRLLPSQTATQEAKQDLPRGDKGKSVQAIKSDVDATETPEQLNAYLRALNLAGGLEHLAEVEYEQVRDHVTRKRQTFKDAA